MVTAEPLVDQTVHLKKMKLGGNTETPAHNYTSLICTTLISTSRVFL